MFKDLDDTDKGPAPGKDPEPGTPAPAAPCDCTCAQPVPADGGEAPAGNRSLVNTGVYWTING